MPQHLHSLLLIKEQLLTGHDAHYAGGIHLFRCLAQQSSTSDQFCAVHTFSLASKGVVLHHAVTHNLLHCLQTCTTTSGVDFITLKQQNGLVDHFAVRPDPLLHRKHEGQGTAATSNSNAVPTEQPSTAAAALLSVVAEVSQQLTCQGHVGHVLLDIDSLQHAQVEACRVPGRGLAGPAASGAVSNAGLCVQAAGSDVEPSGTSNEPGSSAAHAGHQRPFMLALALTLQQLSSRTPAPPSAQHDSPHSTAQDCPQQQQQQVAGGPWHLLAVVQNIHHLPFGPCGTGPRSPLVLQAWQSVAGILTVSHYVQSYLQQHVVPLLPQLQLQPRRVLVTHPCAFRVWGEGPFEDLGSLAADRLWGPGTASTGSTEPADTGSTAPADAGNTGPISDVAGSTGLSSAPCDVSVGQQQQQQQEQQQQQQQQGPGWQHTPVVGMLKLTREKGSDLFLALAAHMPALQLRAVCADPDVRQQAASAGLTNVQLVPPAAYVSAVLAGMSILLVPSVLHEAFGMVVLDALLHGLPVIVAAAGALPEAAAGAAAAVLPVNMVSFPRTQLPHPANDAKGTIIIEAAPAAAAATAAAAAAVTVREGEASALQVAAARAGHTTAASHTEPRCSKCAARGRTAADSITHGSHSTSQPSAGCSNRWLAGQRSWEHRQYACLQQQHIDSWSSAMVRVLHSREAYTVASQRSRDTAHSMLQQSGQQFEALLSWLQLSTTGVWPC